MRSDYCTLQNSPSPSLSIDNRSHNNITSTNNTCNDSTITRELTSANGSETDNLTWVPVHVYAPEFLDTELDIPAQNIEQAFFQYFLSNQQMQNQIHDVMLANKVMQTGIPNRYGCRSPLVTDWKLQKFTELLGDYHDLEVIEWLRFGFPISRDLTNIDPTPATSNHLGATLFPTHIDSYIEKEIRLGGTIEPFTIPPFLHRIGVSPLSTRPKKGLDSRHVIMDLSFPFGESVNDRISKHFYGGEEISLTYPTVDNLAKRIFDLSKVGRVFMWKHDLWWAFRQIPLCPLSYSMIGFRWRNLLFFDKVVPMGL